jgi:hypothetical protein
MRTGIRYNVLAALPKRTTPGVVCIMRSAVSPDTLRRSAGVAVVNMPVASDMTCLDCLGAFGLREESTRLAARRRELRGDLTGKSSVAEAGL